jgi:hypothetical protein
MAIGDILALGASDEFRITSGGNVVSAVDGGVFSMGADADILWTHGTADVIVSNAASGLVIYHDDVFTVGDPADTTKRTRIDSGAITTATTRVLTMPDNNVDLTHAVQSAIVTVATGEVLALNATPKELVAAPGAAYFLEFVSAHLFLDHAGTDYAGVAAGEDLIISYTDGSGEEVGRVETTGFIDASADAHRIVHAGGTKDAVADYTPVANAALVISLLSGEIITGDSPLIVEVLYRVRTLAIA